VRGVLGNAWDVGAADTDIGELTVAQTGQFVEAAVVTLPALEEADDAGKHRKFLFVTSGRRGRLNRIEGNIVLFAALKRNFAALQLGVKCIA
jgi:hypothetical protein